MQETRVFDAAVDKVLNLMIHSLYTNKDIFLRELISNASDACDKLRYLSQINSNVISDHEQFKISISIDKKNRYLIVTDNGVGMDKEDLIINLGTIAKSGTQNFIDQLSSSNIKDSTLIGQFGVGFYSVFMVAEHVEVISQKYSSKKSCVWSSDGLGKYNVSELDDNELSRGTKIILRIKDTESSYLDFEKIKNIIKIYSDHISIPIVFLNEDTKQEVQLNASSALWTKLKSDITQEQYNEFYKNISYASDNPWIIIHNKNEGNIEFTNLLFIPTNKTYDLFHPERKRHIKLYIKRIFITDNNINLIPQFLRFVHGIVDSEDLPLNISRETLQHNHILDKINKLITKKIITELKKKKDSCIDEYLSFWNNFGMVVKEGLCDTSISSDIYESILEICMFHSALHNKMISLDEYISNCNNNQEVIYYYSGDNLVKMINSPQIEGFIKKGVDVLLFTDNVDDFWAGMNNKYKNVTIKSVTRSDIDLNDNKSDTNIVDNSSNSNQDDRKLLIDFFKSTLGDVVQDVMISKKLDTSLACLSVDPNAIDIRMEKFLLDQKQIYQKNKKILELNDKHIIIEKILDNLKQNVNLEVNKNLVRLIFDQACIVAGESIQDIDDFSHRFTKLLEQVM